MKLVPVFCSLLLHSELLKYEERMNDLYRCLYESIKGTNKENRKMKRPNNEIFSRNYDFLTIWKRTFIVRAFALKSRKIIGLPTRGKYLEDGERKINL